LALVLVDITVVVNSNDLARDILKLLLIRLFVGQAFALSLTRKRQDLL
jgi:uncharacterized membrane protein